MRTLTRIKSPTCSLIANYRLRHPNQWPFSARFSTHSSHTLENKREERSAIKHGICYSRWWWLESVWPRPAVWNVRGRVAETSKSGTNRRLKRNWSATMASSLRIGSEARIWVAAGAGRIIIHRRQSSTSRLMSYYSIKTMRTPQSSRP